MASVNPQPWGQRLFEHYITVFDRTEERYPLIPDCYHTVTHEKDIAAAFDLCGRVREVQPYGHGLINNTYLLTTDTNRQVILQRVNRRVFPRPDLISENLQYLANHVMRKMARTAAGVNELKFPEILRTHDGKDFFLDAAGDYWRAMSFIENTCTFEKITSLTQAEEVGYVLGRFHTLFQDLDPARLHETLPGFHNATHYLTQFMQASHQGAPEKDEWRYCFSFIESRQALVPVLESAKRDGRLSLRAIHGDTKLNNFLFDKNSARAISLIDLDTVQPGLIHFDIGDCLRSCANTAGESPIDIGTVYFDLDICRALLARYLAETQGFLTRNDYRYLYDSVRLIPFELGIRFLTDHLEGNRYFRIDWPGQNLHRAMVQFRLTESIERSEKWIRSIIDGLTLGH